MGLIFSFVVENTSRESCSIGHHRRALFQPSSIEISLGFCRVSQIGTSQIPTIERTILFFEIVKKLSHGTYLMAPSYNLNPSADPDTYPLALVPDNKLSVHDVFKIKGDYYEGTDYSLTVAPGETPSSDTQLAGGPWGDPIRGRGFERSIGIHRTCYVHIGQVKDGLPDPIKGISWYGYGHPASTYLTPLWPIMSKLPEFYSTGSRAETFRRDSGWWINTYTQRMAELRWNSAIEKISEFRDPVMADIYQQAADIQDEAARVFKRQRRQYEKHGKVPNRVIKLISDFAYDTAVNWHEDWKYLGDQLLTDHWAVQATYYSQFPEWWLALIKYAPPVP